MFVPLPKIKDDIVSTTIYETREESDDDVSYSDSFQTEEDEKEYIELEEDSRLEDFEEENEQKIEEDEEMEIKDGIYSLFKTLEKGKDYEYTEMFATSFPEIPSPQEEQYFKAESSLYEIFFSFLNIKLTQEELNLTLYP